MKVELTKEEFVEQSKIIHKEKYNYDKFVYDTSKCEGNTNVISEE